jgi:hypothetical protein
MDAAAAAARAQIRLTFRCAIDVAEAGIQDPLDPTPSRRGECGDGAFLASNNYKERRYPPAARDTMAGLLKLGDCVTRPPQGV